MKYTVGFVFNDDFSKVMLIEKNRPKWQAGCLNGVGGKVEGDESFLECQIRETEEEFGVLIEDWDHMTTLSYDNPNDIDEPIEIAMFRTVVTDSVFWNIHMSTDERPRMLNTIEIMNDDFEMINNLRWLIPMAIWEPPCDTIKLAGHTQGYKWLQNFVENMQNNDT